MQGAEESDGSSTPRRKLEGMYGCLTAAGYFSSSDLTYIPRYMSIMR